MGLTKEQAPQMNSDYSKTRQLFSDIFATKTRAEWVKVFEPLDACVTPVLDRVEAAQHPHTKDAFTINNHQLPEPLPAPRLSRTPANREPKVGPSHVGQHSVEIMKEVGYTKEAIEKLLKDGTLMQADSNAKL